LSNVVPGSLYAPGDAAAPEVLRHEEYGFPADVWSYGILVWELVSFWMSNFLDQPSIPTDLLEIVADCLCWEKEGRPTMSFVQVKLEDLHMQIHNKPGEVEWTSIDEAQSMVTQLRLPHLGLLASFSPQEEWVDNPSPFGSYLY
jgi:serine/threonine protein kinase